MGKEVEEMGDSTNGRCDLVGFPAVEKRGVVKSKS